jgi:hypothetical protein
MTKVIADPELRAKLNGLNQQMEVCDETGRTLGYFLTRKEYEGLMIEWAKLKYPPEELDRRSKQGGGRTTAEVLERLNKL